MSSDFRSQPKLESGLDSSPPAFLESEMGGRSLYALEITPGEVCHLSGYEPSEVWRSSLLRDRRSWLIFWFQELILAIALTPIMTGVVYVFGMRPLLGDASTVLWSVWVVPGDDTPGDRAGALAVAIAIHAANLGGLAR